MKCLDVVFEMLPILVFLVRATLFLEAFDGFLQKWLVS